MVETRTTEAAMVEAAARTAEAAMVETAGARTSHDQSRHGRNGKSK